MAIAPQKSIASQAFKIFCLTYLRSTKNQKFPKPRNFRLFCGFFLVYIKIRVNNLDRDYNERRAFDLSGKTQFSADFRWHLFSGT